MTTTTSNLRRLRPQKLPHKDEETAHLTATTDAWVASYLRNDHGYALSPALVPGTIASQFAGIPPMTGLSSEALMQAFEQIIVPGCMKWNDANFMGYFGLGSSSIAILANTLEATLNQTRMLWSTSPAATELEAVVLDWLKDAMGLPDHWFGMMHTNSRVDLAMVAALQARGIHISTNGLTGLPRLCVYASTEAHDANAKAMVMTGLGSGNLRRIPTDDCYRMDTRTLRETIERDCRAGYVPLMVIATVGTTSTTSIDDVAEIARIAREYGIWLHVDAAYAGLFAIDEDMRWILNGCAQADSLTCNPHKPLFLPFDHSIFFIAKPQLLKAAFRSNGAYLTHGATDGAVDLYDYTDKIPHRFPALSVWMTLSFFGLDGITRRHREQRRLAQLVAQWVRNDSQFEIMAPTPLTVVCFRAHPRGMRGRDLNALNKRLLDGVNGRGTYFLSTTLLAGRTVLRIAIGNIQTDEQAVCGIWHELQEVLCSLV